MLSAYSSFASDTGVKFGCIGIKIRLYWYRRPP
jgi:hypothetical protein